MIELTLTRRALLVLDALDNRDGTPFLPRADWCGHCGLPATYWPDRVVCMTTQGASRCLGNTIGRNDGYYPATHGGV